MKATSTTMKKLALAVGLSLATMGSASAAIIASWDFTQEFEFIEPITPASVSKSGATAGAADVDGYTKLEWGEPTTTGGGQLSSLVVNPEAGDLTSPSNVLTAGSVVTSTDLNAFIFADGPSVVHNNFVITGDTLQSADARDYVTLTPSGGGADQIQDILFGIRFEETVNSLTGAACPSGTENAFGCGDIFVLSGGLLGVPTLLNNGTVLAFLIDSFVRDDYTYDVYLREQSGSLVVLSDAACAAAGSVSGCIGWTTNENLATVATLEFGIHATLIEIPEPGTLALLSGGLMLVGWTLRKKTNGGRAA